MLMINKEIKNKLFEFRDIKYRDFQSRLIPTVPKEKVVGVRTPQLRKYAKELSNKKEIDDFLKTLPHEYFEENQIHAFLISEVKEPGLCIKMLNIFLPYVDNWATCDQMSPKVLKKHHEKLFIEIIKWLESSHTYTVRFGIKMLMDHFLDEDFDPKHLEMVEKVRMDEYYVNMMRAWYFATALAKQYQITLPYVEKRKLDEWTHKKTIQKAIESFRLTPEKKEYLKEFR